MDVHSSTMCWQYVSLVYWRSARHHVATLLCVILWYILVYACAFTLYIYSIEHLHQEASLAILMMHSAVWLCGGRCVDEGAVVGAETIANNIILYILKIVNIMWHIIISISYEITKAMHSNSTVAQWESGGLITPRSVDRNHAVLIYIISSYTLLEDVYVYAYRVLGILTSITTIYSKSVLVILNQTAVVWSCGGCCVDV